MRDALKPQKLLSHQTLNLFFHSQYATGRSYDNIAPPAPNGLVASVENTVVTLSWNPIVVDDFNYYSIHRAPDSLFQPNFSNFVGFSASPDYVDDSAPFNVPLYYKVSATDMGGNLGFGSGSAYAYIAVNRPPQAYDVALVPAVPNENDDITVSYVYFDVAITVFCSYVKSVRMEADGLDMDVKCMVFECFCRIFK